MQSLQRERHTAGFTMVASKAWARGAAVSGVACMQSWAHCSAKGRTSLRARISAAAATRPSSPASARAWRASTTDWAVPSAQRASALTRQQAQTAPATGPRTSAPRNCKSTSLWSRSTGSAFAHGTASIKAQAETTNGASPGSARNCCNTITQAVAARATSARRDLAYLERTHMEASARRQSPTPLSDCSSSLKALSTKFWR
mmetsp:Transcript_75115/g.160938  ORF Transcript_75115/g.160938 Transcript_75115/m.160938 type:complete len:202 (+) Transcript_75115:238-843(+)